jgi:hypothetical protein
VHIPGIRPCIVVQRSLTVCRISSCGDIRDNFARCPDSLTPRDEVKVCMLWDLQVPRIMPNDEFVEAPVALHRCSESGKCRCCGRRISSGHYVEVKREETVIGHTLALGSPSGDIDNCMSAGPARSIRDRVCRTEANSVTLRARSVRGGQALRDIHRAVGGRSVY